MTRLLIAIITTSIFQIHSSAQTFKVSGKVSYVTTIRNSLFIKGVGNKMDTTYLYFNDTASSYIVNTKTTADPKKIAARLDNTNMSEDDKSGTVELISNLINSHSILFDYHKNGSKTMSSPYILGLKDYCAVDTLPEFNWVLLPDTTTILGYKCQKAVCDSIFMGGHYRQFVVWYTPDIALSYGPKNIFGLPGLILSADSKYYNFTAVSINIPLQPNEMVQLIPCKNRPVISRKKAEEINSRNTVDFMNMQKLRGNQ